MFYELIACVRPNTIREVRDIAKSAGMTILNGGGVIKGIKNWDKMLLPRRIRKHQTYYTHGHYFLMQFYANGKVQQDVRNNLGMDPRMVKFSVVKVGSTLEEMVRAEEKEDGR